MKLLGDLRSLLTSPLPPSLTLWDAICLLLVGEDEDELIQGYIPYIENHFRKNGMWDERRDWSGDLAGSPLVYFVNHIEVESCYDMADVHSFLPHHVDYLVVYHHNVPTQFDAAFFDHVSCKCVMWVSHNLPPSNLKTEILMFPRDAVCNLVETGLASFTKEYYEAPPKMFFVAPAYLERRGRDVSAASRKILAGLKNRKDVVLCRTISEWQENGGMPPTDLAACNWDWQSLRHRDSLEIGANMFEFSLDMQMDMAVSFYEWCREKAF